MGTQAYTFHCEGFMTPGELASHKPFDGTSMLHRRVKRERLMRERYRHTHALHNVQMDADETRACITGLWNLLNQTRSDMFSYAFKHGKENNDAK